MTQMRKTTLHLFAVLAAGLSPAMAWAITAPATGDLGYDAYDLVVNQMLNGPIGFVGGVASIVAGASQLMKSWMLAILGILAGSVILKADTITASLGMIL